MLTDEEKQLILKLISQITFNVGQSDIARKYEKIVEKLKVEETIEK